MKNTKHNSLQPGLWLGRACVCALLLFTGCGTTKSQLATQQMLTSDAIDRTVGQIDFSVLSGQKIYFDSEYVDAFKPVGFITNKYIISSLRQQMFAAKCIVMDTKEEADTVIIEARVGALGTDEHDVTYGLPASSALNSAASVLASAPAIPVIPEISLARRQEQLGATKISVFAYDRVSRSPVWQSGTSTSTSYAKSFWILGAGPFNAERFTTGRASPVPSSATPCNKIATPEVPWCRWAKNISSLKTLRVLRFPKWRKTTRIRTEPKRRASKDNGRLRIVVKASSSFGWHGSGSC